MEIYTTKLSPSQHYLLHKQSIFTTQKANGSKSETNQTTVIKRIFVLSSFSKDPLLGTNFTKKLSAAPLSFHVSTSCYIF